MISNCVAVAFVVVVVIGFMYWLGREADRKMICNMRNDGLTDEDIKGIIGSEGYNKATKGDKQHVQGNR